MTDSRRDFIRLSAASIAGGLCATPFTALGNELPNPVGQALLVAQSKGQILLSREQQAGIEFQTYSASFKELFLESDSKNLRIFANAFIGAMTNFGQCELYARKAERAKILNVFPEVQRNGLQQSQRQNDKGLELLEHALAAFKSFNLESQGEPISGGRPNLTPLTSFRGDLVSFIVDLEIKASDAEEINKVLTETIEIVSGRGETGILNYVEGKLTELAGVRKRADRGAVSNIPYWKLVGIAIMLGIVVSIV